MTSNLANCLVVKPTEIYYPDPGYELFRNWFSAMVHQQGNTVMAKAVNVWEGYHCVQGEIHCGTASVRLFPPGKPWWEHDVIKEKWRDEK